MQLSNTNARSFTAGLALAAAALAQQPAVMIQPARPLAAQPAAAAPAPTAPPATAAPAADAPADDAKPAAAEPPLTPSKEEIAELKATYDALSPDEQAEMKAYYEGLGIKLEEALGITAAKSAEQNRTRELLGAMRELDFSRKPQAVLAARAKLGFGQVPQPSANTARPQDVAKWLHLYVMAGEWPTVADFLKGRPADEAQGVYSAILQSMNKGDPGLLPEEVLAVAEAAPSELKTWQMTSLSGLMKLASDKHSTGPALAQIRAGTRFFGKQSDDHRKRTVEFLAGAGLVSEAYEFLPSLDDARAAGDAATLLVHAKYKQSLADKSPVGKEAEAHRAGAWELFSEASLLPKATLEQKRDALTQAIALMNRVPRAQVTPWLTSLFSSDTLGPIALEIMALKAISIGDEKLDVEQRAQAILTMKEGVDVLLARSSMESSSLRVPMRMLTTALLSEIENTVKEKGNQRFLTREAQLLLRAVPNAAWFDALEPSLATRATKACISISMMADELDMSLAFLRDGIKRSPDQGIPIADHFLKAWEQRLNPKTEEDDNRFMFYFYREYLPSAPLTRGRQRRNLDRLHALMQTLADIGIEPRSLPSIASAFKACHSKTEVYSKEEIVNVFGPLDKIPSATSAALAETMSASLNGDWRNRAAQRDTGTKRSDSEIAALVDKGYGLALELVDCALAREPDSWRYSATKAGLAFDRMQFRNVQQKMDAAKQNEYRQAAFTAFNEAASRYAKALQSGEEREDIRIYLRWFGAALGTPELNFLRVDEMPTEGSMQDDQIDLIRKSIAALPPDCSFRHLSDFAREMSNAVTRSDPEIKPRLIKHALRVIGDHPAGASLRALAELYRDLVKDELKLRITIDGDDRVGVNRPFGILVSLRFTNAVDRETGGFSKYLQNNVWGRVGRQYREINYRDELQKQIETALGKNFTIESTGFFDPFMPPRGVTEEGQDGWLEKPLAYIILTRKDPTIDRMPQISIDMQFEDQTGPVTLALPSNTPALATGDAHADRPVLDLTVAQIVDVRDAIAGDKDRSIKLEVQARGKGVSADLRDLLDGLDTAINGYTIAENGIELKPTLILQEGEQPTGRFYWGDPKPPKGGYPEPDEAGMYRLNIERTWIVTYTPTGSSLAGEFSVPTLKPGVKAKLESRYYSDLDLVPVTGSTVAVTPRWSWPMRIGTGVGALALAAVAFVVYRRRDKHAPIADTGIHMPDRITPLSAIVTLKKLQSERAAAFDPSKRDALAHDISTLERTYFGPASQIEANGTLDSVVQRWVGRAAP